MIKVSAIVSAYNSEKLIRGCLDDLLRQTLYKKGQLEIVVIDSGSQQGEGTIVKEFQKNNQNIKYIRTEIRETVYAAWNRGIAVAEGEYITNANTDDAHRRDALELLAQALDAYPEADLAYSHNAWTNYPNDAFENSHAYIEAIYPPYDPAIAMLYCLLGPHPLWRREVFDKIGLFDPSYEAVGDYDYLFRFVRAKLKAVLVPEVLSLFYINPKGLSRAENRSITETQKLYDIYHQSIPIACLYQIDINDKKAVTQAWIAQGILASRLIVPWENYELANLFYAVLCFQKALEIEPDDHVSLHNLIAVLGRMQDWQRCGQLIDQYPQVSEKMKDAVRERCPAALIKVDTPPPAVRPLVYPDTRAGELSARPDFQIDYGDGFYEDEGNYRWMCTHGEFAVSAKVLATPVLVSFSLACGNSNYYDTFPLHVDVVVNRQPAGEIIFAESAQKHIIKMRIDPSPNDVIIAFKSNSSFIPALKAGLIDNRKLSVCLRDLRLQQFPFVELFNGEIFIEGKNPETGTFLPKLWTEQVPIELFPEVLGYGFHEKEGLGYFWMQAAGRIEVSAKLLESPVEVTFDLTCGDAKSYDKFPFAVLIFAGDKVNTVLFDAGGQTKKIRLHFDKSDTDAGIVLKSIGSFIPSQKKINDDNRQLSVHLSNLQVVRKQAKAEGEIL
jgi:glycosyltransferase involved in cell wall biosynthesis